MQQIPGIVVLFDDEYERTIVRRGASEPAMDAAGLWRREVSYGVIASSGDPGADWFALVGKDAGRSASAPRFEAECA